MHLFHFNITNKLGSNGSTKIGIIPLFIPKWRATSALVIECYIQRNLSWCGGTTFHHDFITYCF
jgi:hypothetical protein